MNPIGTITLEGCDLEGNLIEGSREYPCYTCGHCSSIVLMRADRQRERLTCAGCGRWLCESNELCLDQCTPIHRLADDHFEAPTKWKRLIPAIMAGVTKMEDGIKKGLIIP